VRIIAHRGGPGADPENSLAAARAAFAAGADAVEMDVRLTRDRVPVLSHDPVRRPGRWPHVIRYSSSRRLGFLDRLAALLAEPAPDRAIPFALDIKRAQEAPAIAQWCLDRRGDGVDPGRIGLWCRDADMIRALPARDQFGEVALLPEPPTTVLGYLDRARDCGAEWVSLHLDMLTADMVEAGHERGLKVYAWVLDPARHQEYVALGVDGLVTDWVSQARSA
jgi:glycerophosphoryl diester phosphodiesterase